MTGNYQSKAPLERTVFGCLAIMFLCVFSYNAADADLWGHVRYGADMIRDGRIFETDPYSYLSGGFKWINHELLCEFTLGYLEPRFGMAGLFAWKCLMGVCMLAALLWNHRRGHFELLTVVFLATLLALNLWPGWTFRPQIFTYTFLSLLALLLTEHSRGHRRVLWFAAPLFVAWTNAHGGFVAGLAIFATHVTWSACGEWRERAAGWTRRILELVAVSCAAGCATLVNPYGIRLLVWIWDSLTWPRPEITEWQPVAVWNADYLPFKVLVLASLIVLAKSRRPRDWRQIAILSLVAAQAFLHRRHIPLFAILAAYWLPEHVDDCVRRLRHWARTRLRLPSVDLSSIRMYGCGFAALAVLLGSLSVAQWRSIAVKRSTFPVAAFEFIERHQLSGRMVTEFNWGQYCLYAFGPRIQVSVDGRFDTAYAREVLDINLDFMMGDRAGGRHRSPDTGPFRADRVLEVGLPNLALVDRQRANCVAVIESHGEWVLLYQDALAQVWGRRDVYDDPKRATYLAPANRSVSDTIQSGYVAYPALPRTARRGS